MAHETPMERLGRELEAAAERQMIAIAAAPRRRGRPRWRGRSLGLFVAAVGFGVGAGAWAATQFLATGSPVPFVYGAPVAGVAEGAPLPGTVRLLADNVPDPAGGPPWGMRYWETDRKYGCVQVGRVYQGKLGQITGGKVFHELRIGVLGSALGGCFILDGNGHAFAAVYTDARHGGQPAPCPSAMGTLRTEHGVIRCDVSDRTIDFGLLGPHATSYVARVNDRDRRANPLGAVGGYLVVQKRLPPTLREVGFHHKDPKLNTRAVVDPTLTLTPASKVIRRVDYAAGTCMVRLTQDIFGACRAQMGYAPIQQPKVRDVRAPVRLVKVGDGRTFRVRFRARQPVVDGRSAYYIQIWQRNGRENSGKVYEHNLRAGDLVKTTFRARNGWRGAFVVSAYFRTVRARPGPIGSPAHPGVLVGRAEITFD
jgi:hypothetical protein